MIFCLNLKKADRYRVDGLLTLKEASCQIVIWLFFICFRPFLYRYSVRNVAMVVVAAVALSSATYAWFVSNNQVTATTTQISAQSNAAYLLIEAGSKTTTNSTTSDTAAETVGTGSGQTYADAALYPAQWKNNFDASKTTTGDKIYQFETAYASDKTKANEKTGTRFAVGDPSAAVTADYALLNTFYVGTGTYDGEFTNLKVSNMTVTATEDASLKTAMRLLIMAYAPDGSGNYGTTPTSWVVAKYNDGTTATIESQSLTGEGTAGVVYIRTFMKLPISIRMAKTGWLQNLVRITR